MLELADTVEPGILFSGPTMHGMDLIPEEFMPENIWFMLPVRKPGENELDWFMRGAIMIDGEVMKLDSIRQSKGYVVQKIGDQAQVQIVFDDATGSRLEYIKRAEEYLLEAGVEFDTGYHLKGEHKHRRVWQFDCSLEGASVVYKGIAQADKAVVITAEEAKE